MPRITVTPRPRTSPLRSFFEQRMVRPGHRRAREQQDQRVEERDLERIEGMDALGRPDAADRRETAPSVKKAQKKAAKNITSEAMNSAMP